MRVAPDPTLRFVLTWQLAVLGLVLMLPAAILGDWPWELQRKEQLPYFALLAAFGLSALYQLLIRGQSCRPRIVLAVLGTAAIFSAPLLWLVISRANSSRVLLLAIFFTAIVILTVPLIGRPLRIVGTLALGATMAGTAALAAKRHFDADRQAAVQTVESFISTNLYNVSLKSHQGGIPRPAVRGGGFSRFADRVLLATGDGYLYLLDATRGLDAQKLPYRIPINGEEFAAAVGREYKEPARGRDFGTDAPPGVQTWRFRVAGVLVQDLGSTARIFASHHYWDSARQCFTIRLSALEVDKGTSSAPSEGVTDWQTIFDALPCLPLSGPDAKQGKNPFYGEESGGRLALLDEHTLLLTVGDMGFSGLESSRMLAQDPQSAYGKTVRIDLATGAHEMFTSGHRNAQGLYIGDGEIWITEHGPKGGDELNVLSPGANYGWPMVTYGTDYRTFTWPLSAQQGRHEGYEEAVYAWVPSIGVTNLIRLSGGDAFPAWEGDFLVGSLTTRSLYRMRIQDRRVLFCEPIPLDTRVRDLIELDDGRILIWTDEASIVEIAPAPGMNGALLFGNMCANCHSIRDGLMHRAGPDLHGVMGRRLAAASGFEYSPAMRSAGGRWTAEKLDAFLADPQATMPGTSMATPGIDDERERALLIEHLRSAAQAR